MEIHDYDRELELNKATIEESEHVGDRDRKAIFAFGHKLFAQGLSTGRVRKYFSMLHSLERMAPEWFDLHDAEQSDLEVLVSRLEQSDLAEATKKDYKTAIKKFYKVMEGDGDTYPEKVGFFSTCVDKSKIPTPDPLTEDELDRLWDTCTTTRDLAMFRVLWEGGLRPSELLGIRVKDITFLEEGGYRLRVDGKTGVRKIFCIETEDVLRRWLDEHPYSDQQDYPVWIKIDPSNIKAANGKEEMHVSYAYFRKRLKERCVEADIRVIETDAGNETSDVTPTLLRHTRATQLAEHLSEAIMKQYFGWEQNSDMPRIYIHLNGAQMERQIREIQEA